MRLTMALLLSLFVASAYFAAGTTSASPSSPPSRRNIPKSARVRNIASVRPHIIFILADDLGWNDVSFHGSPQIPTPNIDSLAGAGIILNNYYVNPICTPSRSSLMTGRYPSHLGMQHDVISENEPWGLPLNVTLLPQHLARLGYRRHIVGKWHLGAHSAAYAPLQRGFQSHLGYWGGNQDYYDHTSELKLDGRTQRGHDMRRNMEPAFDLNGKYATDVYTEQAKKVIKLHDASQPLFLYVAHLAVHAGRRSDPLQAPWEIVQKFKHIKDPRRRVYAAMVYKLDRSVGKIVRALEEKGMLENSIIVFSTDNGGAAGGINLNAGSNWPLKGTKYTSWEGGVRGVGLIWSRRLQGSEQMVFDHMMHLVDWLPTLYSAAGGRIADLGPIDGIDMWPALSRLTRDSPRKEILLDLDPIWQKSSIRVENWKLVNGTWADGAYDKWFGPSGVEDTPSFYIRSLRSDDRHRILAPGANSSGLARRKLRTPHFTDKVMFKGLENVVELESTSEDGSPAEPAQESLNSLFGFDPLREQLRTSGSSGGQNGRRSRGIVYPIVNVTALLSKRRQRILGELAASQQPPGSVARGSFFVVRTSVDCGKRPTGEALRKKYMCEPEKAPCLFDVTSDPCEYRNVAAENPEIVDRLWSKLMSFKASAVQPLNKPGDPRANPKYWGYTWTNWKDFA